MKNTDVSFFEKWNKRRQVPNQLNVIVHGGVGCLKNFRRRPTKKKFNDIIAKNSGHGKWRRTKNLFILKKSFICGVIHLKTVLLFYNRSQNGAIGLLKLYFKTTTVLSSNIISRQTQNCWSEKDRFLFQKIFDTIIIWRVSALVESLRCFFRNDAFINQVIKVEYSPWILGSYLSTEHKLSNKFSVFF